MQAWKRDRLKHGDDDGDDNNDDDDYTINIEYYQLNAQIQIIDNTPVHTCSHCKKKQEQKNRKEKQLASNYC